MNSTTSIEELLVKYVNNECSREELKLIFVYLSNSWGDSALHANIDAQIQAATDDTSQLENTGLAEQMYAAIKHTIQQQSAASRRLSKQSRLASHSRSAASMAAKLKQIGLRYCLFSKQTHLLSFTTPNGQTLSLTLPDRSHVILQGNSTIRYAASWKKHAVGKVWLKGEAFFSVKPTASYPKLRVITSTKIYVEVKETAFSIYHRNPQTRVMLHSGKATLTIQEAGRERRLAVKAGEIIEFINNASTYLLNKVNHDPYSCPINKRLILKNTSFREIALLLKETYGLSVVVPNPSLYEDRFSGIMPCENAAILLTALCLSFNLTYEKNDHQVTFFK